MLQLNPGLIIWTVLTFCLLLIVLRAAAWKPILKALDMRERTIRQSLDAAEEAKNEAQRILEENKKNLANAEEAAQEVLREARSLSEKMKAEALSKAKTEGDKLIEKAHDEIERDKRLAMTQLHGLVVELAVRAAEKILNETMDEARQKKLVESFINSLSNEA